MYSKIFDPAEIEGPPGGGAPIASDRSDGSIYVYQADDIVLAVNVALVTSRPLLISGPAGSGKSSLAPNVARVLDADSRRTNRWTFGQHVITPRTQASDLLWRYDAVRRFRDAQAGELSRDGKYVQPGILWRAFAASHHGTRAVVLLDEIDKADPDVPNSLLEVLGNLSFTVAETGETITAAAGREPLIILTTNDERDLPRPFLRRCVTLTLKRATPERLEAIARAHGLGADAQLARELALRIEEIAVEAEGVGRPGPSAAEYLDALRACIRLAVSRSDSDDWRMIEAATLRKNIDPHGGTT